MKKLLSGNPPSVYQDCGQCGRTFRQQKVASGNPDNCPACKREHEMHLDRFNASLIGDRIRKRKILDSQDAVARRLKTKDGLPA
ncbi:MAG: hypothetical protein OXS40_04910 [Gammaproteobacteria bacterium]|nr:hypothetical protein [Gammaproteobacteria bacterium]